MLKTLKKTGLSLLSLAMSISMLTLTPMVKVSAATASLINSKNFTVLNTGGMEVTDANGYTTSWAAITPDRIKSAIFDGDQGTYWQSAMDTTAYGDNDTALIIDLGQEYQISKVVYKARNAGNPVYCATGNADNNVYVDLATTRETYWDSENDVTGSANTNWGESTVL